MLDLVCSWLFCFDAFNFVAIGDCDSSSSYFPPPSFCLLFDQNRSVERWRGRTFSTIFLSLYRTRINFINHDYDRIMHASAVVESLVSHLATSSSSGLRSSLLSKIVWLIMIALIRFRSRLEVATPTAVICSVSFVFILESGVGCVNGTFIGFISRLLWKNLLVFTSPAINPTSLLTSTLIHLMAQNW